MDVWRLADIDNETIQDPHYPGKAFYTTTAPTAAQSGHAPTQVGDGGVPGMELETGWRARTNAIIALYMITFFSSASSPETCRHGVAWRGTYQHNRQSGGCGTAHRANGAATAGS